MTKKNQNHTATVSDMKAFGFSIPTMAILAIFE